MGKILKLRPDSECEVKQIIDEAIAEDFKEIIVLGVRENGEIWVRTTGLQSITRMMGYVAVLQYDLYGFLNGD